MSFAKAKLGDIVSWSTLRGHFYGRVIGIVKIGGWDSATERNYSQGELIIRLADTKGIVVRHRSWVNVRARRGERVKA